VIQPGYDGSVEGGVTQQQAAAAADVEQGQSVKRADAACIAPEMGRRGVADELKANGVELVEWRELACRIPPFRRHRGKFRDFGRVDRGIGHRRNSR
jgi:hypothetical protein